MKGSAVVTDYDFRLGKSHLRGTGCRGLAALAIVLTMRAAGEECVLRLLGEVSERFQDGRELAQEDLVSPAHLK